MSSANSLLAVDRYFQFSLLGLVATGFFALANTGRLDTATIAFMSIALLLRAVVLAGLLRFSVPQGGVVAAAIAYIVFYPVDFLWLSRDFFAATVHGVCFLAAIKVLTGRTDRDLPYTCLVAFVQLIAAAFLAMQPSFVIWLVLFLLFTVAVFTSGEVRRGLVSANQVATPPVAIHWRLGATAAIALGLVTVLSAGFFILVPRTARAAAFLFPGASRLSGFSGVVDLGAFGAISKDDRAVVHILSYGTPLPPDMKWRGTTLSRFDGRRWFEPTPVRPQSVPLASGRAEVADRLQRSRLDGRRLLYRVDSSASTNGTLFIAGIPEYINVGAPRLVRRSGNTWQALPPTNEALRYEVSALLASPLPEVLTESDRSRYLALPRLDARIPDLAREWSGQGTPLERASHIEQRLHEDFQYTLEGAPARTRDPLARFLFIDRKGYCEYFASAMAVMLRSIGIPARVVTGFQRGYFNSLSGMTVLRASDAHAWVEGWVPERGWVTFDPTPSTLAPDSGLFSRLNMYLDAVDSVWQQWIVTFDINRQATIAARVESFLRKRSAPTSVELNRTSIAWFLAILIAIAALWKSRSLRSRIGTWLWLNRATGRKPAQGDVSRLYEVMLRKAGLNRPADVTPSAFAASLATEPLRSRVIAFTDRYNRARFGEDSEVVAEMAAMLREWPR